MTAVVELPAAQLGDTQLQKEGPCPTTFSPGT